MARTLTVAQRAYAAGSYGPFGIDSFAKGDTDDLEVVLTVVGWPTASPLFEMWLSWNGDGKEAHFVVPWVSGQTDKAGTTITEARFRFGVPNLASGKADVANASARVQLYAPLTTAVTVRAI